MSICNYEWFGPYLKPSGQVIHVRQACALPRGHSGDHCSRDKVTFREPDA